MIIKVFSPPYDLVCLRDAVGEVDFAEVFLTIIAKNRRWVALTNLSFEAMAIAQFSTL